MPTYNHHSNNSHHKLDRSVKKVLSETRREAESIVRGSGKKLNRGVSKTSSWRDKLRQHSPGQQKSSRRGLQEIRSGRSTRQRVGVEGSERVPRTTTPGRERVHISRSGDVDVDIGHRTGISTPSSSQTPKLRREHVHVSRSGDVDVDIGKQHVHVDSRTGAMDINFSDTQKFLEIENIQEEKALLRDKLKMTERSRRDASHKMEYWKSQVGEKFKRERDLEIEIAKAREVASSLRKQSEQEQNIFRDEILKSRKRVEELEMRVMEASSSLDSREVHIRNLESKLQEMTGELASTHTRLRAQIMRNEERERWFQAQLSESNDTIEALGLNLKEAKILNEDSENSTPALEKEHKHTHTFVTRETGTETLRSRLEDLERERMDLMSERDAARFEIQNTREREKVMASQLTDSETSFGKLNMELRDARRTERTLRDELIALKQELDRKNSDLLSANAEKRDAEAKAIEQEEKALGCERREVLMKQKVEMLRKRLRLRDETEARDRSELEESRDLVNQRDVRIVELERELEAHKISEREMKNRVTTYESRLSQINTRLRVTEKVNEELRSRVQREELQDESKRLSRFRASALSDVGMKRSRALLSPSSSYARETTPFRSSLLRSSGTLNEEDQRMKQFQMELDLEEKKIQDRVAQSFRDGDAIRMIETKNARRSSSTPTRRSSTKEHVHVTPQGDVDVDMISRRGLHEHVHVDSKTGAVDIDVGRTHLHINGNTTSA